MTNLDGTSDENLVVDTPAFAASPSTNPCLVYLNMFPRLAADTILIGPHHASAELVENAEGRATSRASSEIEGFGPRRFAGGRSAVACCRDFMA